MSETESETKNVADQNDDQNDESESSNSCILNASSVEVKLEIELKEGENVFPNEFNADNREQYMNFNPYTIHFNGPPCDIQTDMNVWNCGPRSLTNMKDAIYLGLEQEQKSNIQVYEHFINTPCDTSKNSTTSEQQISESTSSGLELEPFILNNSSTSQTSTISSQCEETSDNIRHCKRWKPTDAQKKRVYRNKIKEENPDLWNAMKHKERCKKREQREEKRVILFEMQKTQAYIAECEASEVECHKEHLQRLRDRYPDVWIQFANDMITMKDTFPSNNKGNTQKTQWLTEAEKKRFYRKRIKEENPELWSAIKMKDACKKREQREEKRQILLEMRKTQELISNSNSDDVEDHKAHLESLKEKHPDLWIQLEDAIAATQMRNKMLMLDNQRSKRTTKPVQMYKDVIEAHKKYVYRQRLKEERPEYYAQMKARDAYKKSVKRMMMKKGIYSVNGGFDFSAISTESNEFSINVGYNIIDGYNITAESNDYNIITENHEYAINAEPGAFTASPDNDKLDVNG